MWNGGLLSRPEEGDDVAEDEYLLSRVDLGVEIDAELERLRLLEQALDPLSRRNLTETGLAEGWRCVEIGAGGGSILRWLQDRVGATGHVTAVDIRTTYVDDLAAHPTVTMVCADVREFEFPDGLDLVHERLTVGWIPEGAEVRKRAIDALRPSGWYVSEAAGAARRRDPVVPEYPGATEFEALWDRMNDMLTNTSGADAYAGRVQGAALAEAGWSMWSAKDSNRSSPEARQPLSCGSEPRESC